MLTHIKETLSGLNRRTAALLALASVLAMSALAPLNASAAADPATGIDWTTDLVTPALTSAKGAVLAGVVVMGFIMAVALGRRAVKLIAK